MLTTGSLAADNCPTIFGQTGRAEIEHLRGKIETILLACQYHIIDEKRLRFEDVGVPCTFFYACDRVSSELHFLTGFFLCSERARSTLAPNGSSASEYFGIFHLPGPSSWVRLKRNVCPYAYVPLALPGKPHYPKLRFTKESSDAFSELHEDVLQRCFSEGRGIDIEGAIAGFGVLEVYLDGGDTISKRPGQVWVFWRTMQEIPPARVFNPFDFRAFSGKVSSPAVLPTDGVESESEGEDVIAKMSDLEQLDFFEYVEAEHSRMGRDFSSYLSGAELDQRYRLAEETNCDVVDLPRRQFVGMDFMHEKTGQDRKEAMAKSVVKCREWKRSGLIDGVIGNVVIYECQNPRMCLSGFFRDTRVRVPKWPSMNVPGKGMVTCKETMIPGGRWVKRFVSDSADLGRGFQDVTRFAAANGYAFDADSFRKIMEEGEFLYVKVGYRHQ